MGESGHPTFAPRDKGWNARSCTGPLVPGGTEMANRGILSSFDGVVAINGDRPTHGGGSIVVPDAHSMDWAAPSS